MPGAGISRRAAEVSRLRNFLPLFAILFLSLPIFGQSAPGGAPTPAVPPPPTIAPPGQAASAQQRIRVPTDLVALRVTVTDDKGQFVPNLQQDNFRVFEDKVEQKIAVFSNTDVPVTMGLVIDNSGSMREKRAQVNAAALTFVKTSNPQDEAFVVNFNDEYYLDTEHDFTSDEQELNEALSRIDTRGSTALYDAIVGSLDHIKKGHKDKKVLLVITDGDDDASRMTLEQALKAAEQSNAAIYAIGVFSDDDRKNDKRMVRHSKKVLAELADATGGMAYFPDSLDQVEPVCAQVARDIRNQYTIGYYPSNTVKDGSFRSIQLQLIPPRGRGKMFARTRSGYYAEKTSTGD
jgi:Ca-activated chloride channel homolog